MGIQSTSKRQATILWNNKIGSQDQNCERIKLKKQRYFKEYLRKRAIKIWETHGFPDLLLQLCSSSPKGR